ncbi:MAG TPA: hypothetical protein VID04_04385 [Methylomirabilota bacterium]
MVVVWALIALAAPRPTQAQATGEVPPDASGVFICSKPSVPQSSNQVIRDLRTEFRDLTYDFCRVKEDYQEGGWSGMLDRQFGTVQDLVVDLFVGHGLHPTIGAIVPESDVAFGLALNNEWHVTEAPHTRLTTSVEARGSTEGFWAAGAVSHMQIDWYRVSDVGSFRMPQVTLAVRHFDLPKMPFFGLGNQTSRDDRSLFELTETELPILVDFPVGYGLTLSAQANALFAASNPSSDFNSRFSESTAPGIRASTTHLVPGVAATYRSPDVLYGLYGEGRVSYEAYQALAGGSFSFDRVQARMAVHYGIEDQPFAQAKFPYLRSLLGSSRFTVEANLVISEPRSGNSVPFYLQPTLGGGDINNENWLRSYENYRFRAPNTMAFGVSYERRLIDPFGFSIFAQWGKVGADVGDLGFDGLKSSVGVGLTVRLGGKAVVEFSFAWGSEGSQAYATGNTNNAIGFGARAAGTVGLRGVF